MNDLSPHPTIDSIPPAPPHPYLGTLHASEICGSISSINGDRANEGVYNRKNFLRLNILIESNQPATPTRAASRKFQTVQEIAAAIGATAQVMSREDIGGVR